MNRYSGFGRLLLVLLLLNILLVATHKGEFWPFSIFPMFSQAGNPWSRAVVERVEDPSGTDLWRTRSLQELRGNAVGLYREGMDPIDIANFVSKTREWDDKRIEALRALLDAGSLQGEHWMVNQVRGRLTETDSVIVEGTPLFLFSADTTLKNPSLFGGRP